MLIVAPSDRYQQYNTFSADSVPAHASSDAPTPQTGFDSSSTIGTIAIAMDAFAAQDTLGSNCWLHVVAPSTCTALSGEFEVHVTLLAGQPLGAPVDISPTRNFGTGTRQMLSLMTIWRISLRYVDAGMHGLRAAARINTSILMNYGSRWPAYCNRRGRMRIGRGYKTGRKKRQRLSAPRGEVSLRLTRRILDLCRR